ncbi:fimbrial protein [Rahnella bonaserana]|jgi:type 1 fimbria pilin|uniref:Fimbrial protein n=1 Tax=Rahnella bonaserana TaxID=2816248 RepID=A0ABS6LT67_9GAMM|nr:hypothetical protein [Rahnella bonaserana]MBU9855229.1 hypothetical protein [Rahnella bonaserana]MCL9643133.1 hypothetical protein [Rahnella victoriana]
MKKLALVLFLAGLANSAWAADSIDVQFKGTLTNPTCTATFTGSTGTDLHFPTMKASVFNSLQQGAIVPGDTVPGYIKFTSCGGGVTAVNIQFVGKSVSGYGFQGKAMYFTQGAATSQLGMVLFKSSSDTSEDNAIPVSSATTAIRYPLASMVKEGSDYKYNVFGRLVLAKPANPVVTGDLTASGVINISYE